MVDEIYKIAYGGLVFIFGVSLAYMITRKLFFTTIKYGFLSLDWRASTQGQIATILIVGLSALGILTFIIALAYVFRPGKPKGTKKDDT